MGQVLLITGASRGIGAATAKLAAARGYTVCVNYVGNKVAADSVVEACRAAGGQALAVQADISRPDEIERLFGVVDATYGRLDAFFNNAGIYAPAARFVDISVERLQRMVATNSVGPFIAAQAAVRRMSKRLGGRGGVIVNMSSMAARMGAPGEATDYGFTKGAIETLTVGLAKELAADGIRVNAVKPGLIYTDIHDVGGTPDRVDKLAHLVPMQRGGTPDEVAEAVLWLMSDRASYITGVSLDVGGGRGI
jgi:NAD(P)-dependent dehydrogenase (short-subunit alcohol dehydrogenase family)